MPQLFTAADIRRLANELKSELLVLGPADLITPEAVDVAREVGVRLVREEERGANAPAGLAAGSHGPTAAWAGSPPPLKVVRGAGMALEAFGVGLASAGTEARLKDVVTSSDRSPMAAGYMTLDTSAPDGGVLPWTLSYDEVDVVLEGELIITRGQEVVRGGPGDVIFIPKGSSITFGTRRRTRFVYVAYPADWNKS